MNPTWPIAYAADFVSYLLQKSSTRDLSIVEAIVLYGSAARGQTTDESDVDIFIQVSRPSSLSRRIARLVADFEASARVLDHWRPLGVRLPLSVKVGRPQDWAAIPDALSDGKVLFGPYRLAATAAGSPGSTGTTIVWENIKDHGVRTNVYRGLFGYVSHGKKYPGLIARLGGRRLTKGAVWVPSEHLASVLDLFRKYRVTCRMMRSEGPGPSAPPPAR